MSKANLVPATVLIVACLAAVPAKTALAYGQDPNGYCCVPVTFTQPGFMVSGCPITICAVSPGSCNATDVCPTILGGACREQPDMFCEQAAGTTYYATNVDLYECYEYTNVNCLEQNKQMCAWRKNHKTGNCQYTGTFCVNPFSDVCP